jgi:hypothetical protein
MGNEEGRREQELFNHRWTQIDTDKTGEDANYANQRESALDGEGDVVGGRRCEGLFEVVGWLVLSAVVMTVGADAVNDVAFGEFFEAQWLAVEGVSGYGWKESGDKVGELAGEAGFCGWSSP